MRMGSTGISAKEHVLMLGGTGLKKSTLLKLLRKMIRDGDNSQPPGLCSVMSQLGLDKACRWEHGDLAHVHGSLPPTSSSLGHRV